MQKLTERIDDLKQRIAAWGKRIWRYTERSTRFNQNRLFQSDQKRLYKSLERPIVNGTGHALNQADTVSFWRSLWSEPVKHSEDPWTEVVASQCAGITPMDPVIITPDDVAEAVRRAPNWKSPGLDGLHHYWLKGFMVCHAGLARQFQEALNQKSLPSFFTTGITHLVPKDQGTTDPSKYCPITLFTADYIEDFIELIRKDTDSLDFNNIQDMEDHLLHYWLGISKQEFGVLLNLITRLNEMRNGAVALAIYLLKLRTEDSNRRISSITQIPTSTLQ
ncbi:unnamed protein product [Parnassius apollo]|uniref:(apollo) hypothetical protein n=1 Tax=Parnassius apollo TaxID=110799 RepID=A0A8S3Y1F3_PARAO|nr:unnamed protein product [Parnassius apollo]